MSFQNSSFSNFRNIQITKFHHSVFRKEDIGTFYISMDDLFIMERFQAQHHLVENGPNVSFLGKARGLFSIVDFSLEITIVTIFHHDAEAIGMRLEESFFVSGDIWMLNRSQNSYFIQCIFFFFLRKLHHFYFFKGVSLFITLSCNFEYFRERA